MTDDSDSPVNPPIPRRPDLREPPPGQPVESGRPGQPDRFSSNLPDSSRSASPLTGIVVGTDVFSARVTRILREKLKDVDIVNLRSIGDVKEWVEKGHSASQPIAFLTVVVGASLPTGDELLRPIADEEPFRLTQFVLLSTSKEVSGVAWLADQGRLDFLCYIPDFQSRPFVRNLKDQLRRFKVSAGLLEQAELHSNESFVFDMPLTDEEIMAKIVDGIDGCLGRQPRIVVPPGVKLTVENQAVEEATLVLHGSVMLQREMSGGQVLLHRDSTGPIIGLLSLTRRRKAFFTARTASEVVGVHLTFEQLNFVIHERPDIAVLVATVFIRSLDRRLRHSERIQIEHRELSRELEEERRNLSTALTNLEAARTELMTQERLASLGSLAAGVAHELNNPMAAIHRIGEHLASDVSGLLSESPDGEWGRRTVGILEEARRSSALSTREERELRRRIAEATGDRAAAQRLVLAGVHDLDLAVGAVSSGPAALESAERAASIGTQLRNLESASRRIRELVASLRSYARPDGDPVVNVDVHEGIEDTLRLLSHRLHGIAIRRSYAELPRISCHPGQLAQVWTNIMTNAAEALVDAHGGPPLRSDSAAKASSSLDGTFAAEPASDPAKPARAEDAIGTVTITTSAPEPGWIRVVFDDDGPGIPDDVLPRIFEPRFTTKSGRVRFGMGIGLSVCRAIIGRHHGTIGLESTSRGTRAIVDLPTEPPPE